MIDLLLTFAAAAAMGCLLLKLKVPGGMMVGAIVGAALLNITEGTAYMPSQAKLLAQCMAGAFIGCSASRDDIKSMRSLGKPAAVLLAAMLCLNMILGTVLYLTSPMDLLTSMLCAVPGGMSDTPIIAADLGADATKVALMQFVRLIAGIGIFPSVILAATKDERRTQEADASKDVSKQQNKGAAASAADRKRHRSSSEFALTATVAVVCGVAGKKLGVPAGALVFSMLGVMVMKICFDRAYLPMWAKRMAQILSGAYIGCGINASDLVSLRYMVVPALIILAGYSINCLVVGRILNRQCGFDKRTAMLTATPAGASDMALISADLGVDSKELVELQIIRMVVVVSVFPQIICAVAGMFG